MPPAWVHSILNVICLGREDSWLHKMKDDKHIEYGPLHRKFKHELYQKCRKNLNKGHSLDEVIDWAIKVIKRDAKSFGDWLQKTKGKTEEEKNNWQHYRVLYNFHDIHDLIWDEKTDKERRVLEIAIRDIWLNPEKYKNMFPDWFWGRYYTSSSYKSQKEFLEGLEIRCDDIDEEVIEREKRELKSMKFWG